MRCKEALEAEMKEKARQKRLERKLKRQKNQEKTSDIYDLDNSISEYCKHNNKSITNEIATVYWHDYGPKRMYVHNIVTSKYFDLAIAAVIGINVISMAMEFYMMPSGLKYILRALNYFFTCVFTLEAIFKFYALGIVRFLDERFIFLLNIVL